MNSLKNKLIPRDKEKEKSEDKSSYDVVNSSLYKEPMDLISNENSENGTKVSLPNMVTCKMEDANSAKSDVVDDSDSPQYCTYGNNPSAFMEPTDSSHALEHSDDFSQDEEDIINNNNDDDNNLSENLLTLPCLPKVEDVCYDDPHENSCHFGFPVEDQTFCFWPY